MEKSKNIEKSVKKSKVMNDQKNQWKSTQKSLKQYEVICRSTSTKVHRA